MKRGQEEGGCSSERGGGGGGEGLTTAGRVTHDREQGVYGNTSKAGGRAGGRRG